MANQWCLFASSSARVTLSQIQVFYLLSRARLALNIKDSPHQRLSSWDPDSSQFGLFYPNLRGCDSNVRGNQVPINQIVTLFCK